MGSSILVASNVLFALIPVSEGLNRIVFARRDKMLVTGRTDTCVLNLLNSLFHPCASCDWSRAYHGTLGRGPPRNANAGRWSAGPARGGKAPERPVCVLRARSARACIWDIGFHRGELEP